MGRKAEAIRCAEASHGLNDNPIAIARACNEFLLSSGLAEEAYARCAIAANQGTTFLATFRAIARKYPTRAPAKVLDDPVASTPGQEGKRFAVEAGLAALRWIAAGHGCEITGVDVLAACSSTLAGWRADATSSPGLGEALHPTFDEMTKQPRRAVLSSHSHSIINEPSKLLSFKTLAAASKILTVIFTVNLSSTSIGAGLRAIR